MVYPLSVIQLPFARVQRYGTSVAVSPGGVRKAFYDHATPLWRWEISYSALTDAEMTSLSDFYIAAGGRYAEWTFTDPEDASVHTKCQFGMDDLVIRRIARNQNSCTVLIEEYA